LKERLELLIRLSKLGSLTVTEIEDSVQ